MEGLFVAFIDIERQKAEAKNLEKLSKAIIKSRVSQCFYHQVIKLGILPDKKRVYFPKSWVSWADYFFEVAGLWQNHSLFDLKVLISKGKFTETEVLFIEAFLAGETPRDIADRTGYGLRHINLTFQRLEGRLKDKDSEIKFIPKKKYGIIGPKNQRNKKGLKPQIFHKTLSCPK
jgi:hypothetical protein